MATFSASGIPDPTPNVLFNAAGVDQAALGNQRNALLNAGLSQDLTDRATLRSNAAGLMAGDPGATATALGANPQAAMQFISGLGQLQGNQRQQAAADLQASTSLAQTVLGVPPDQQATAWAAGRQQLIATGHKNVPPEQFPGVGALFTMRGIGMTALEQLNGQSNYPMPLGQSPWSYPGGGQGAGSPGAAPGSQSNAAPAAGSIPLDQRAGMVARATAGTMVPPEVLNAQIQQESQWIPGAVGKSGEIGLAQVMPSTAGAPGYGMASADPNSLRNNPEANLAFGARYLEARGKAAGLVTPEDWRDPVKVNRALNNYNGGGTPGYGTAVLNRVPAFGGAAPVQVASAASTNGMPATATDAAPASVSSLGPAHPAPGLNRTTQNALGRLTTSPGVSADNTFVVGDSIGQGIAGANSLPGVYKVGAPPQAVMGQINGLAPEQVQGKNVVLSGGASNAAGNTDLLEQQIKALKAKGAASVTVVGVGDARFPGANARLANIAQRNGAAFTGPITTGPDGVHPPTGGYRGLGLNVQAAPNPDSAVPVDPANASVPLPTGMARRITPQDAVQQATNELGDQLHTMSPTDANNAVQERAQQIVNGQGVAPTGQPITQQASYGPPPGVTGLGVKGVPIPVPGAPNQFLGVDAKGNRVTYHLGDPKLTATNVGGTVVYSDPTTGKEVSRNVVGNTGRLTLVRNPDGSTGYMTPSGQMVGQSGSTLPLDLGKQDYERDQKVVADTTDDLAQLRQQEYTLRDARDVSQGLQQTGFFGAGKARAASLIESTFGPDTAHSAEKVLGLDDASSSEQFNKLMFTAASTQENQNVGARGGYNLTKAYTAANPGLQSQKETIRDIVNVQSVANAMHQDFAQGQLNHIAQQGQSFRSNPGGGYQPSSAFAQQWANSNQPRIYLAAAEALNQQPFAKWSKGLSHGEQQQALAIAARVNNTASYQGPQGQAALTSYGTPSGGQGGAQTSTPTPAAPTVGAVSRGYRFNGGDPSSPASWSKVQ